jgi:two-component system sensor histidine kinase/response regulator
MSFLYKTIAIFDRIKTIGYTPVMDSYGKRRLGIFNLINFFGLVTGLFIPFLTLSGRGYIPPVAWIVSFAPIVISGVVLLANHYKFHNFAIIWYFITYPYVTALVYVGSVDVGLELFFILYGVFAVFFLQKLVHILSAITFSVICYFVIFILYKNYKYVLSDLNYPLYVFIHVLSLALIFVGLFLIKKENTDFQLEMKAINEQLHLTNEEIVEQDKQLAHKAELLEAQTIQLTELNAVKNRLFSIISHDLRTPIYGLRNLFKNMQQYDLPGEEIKLLLPDIVDDLHYTTSLMENLLQWAKSQMHGHNINPQLLDIGSMITDVQQLVRLQAENKKVYLNVKIGHPVYIYADKDMIDLVLRNLLSNAIKFTPQQGEVSISTCVKDETVEVLVQDTGTGISEENMLQLFSNNYFTTKGTSNETGTGLGLMLCKEFLAKNGGDIRVESKLGTGSVFTFTLPKA